MGQLLGAGRVLRTGSKHPPPPPPLTRRFIFVATSSVSDNVLFGRRDRRVWRDLFEHGFWIRQAYRQSWRTFIFQRSQAIGVGGTQIAVWPRGELLTPDFSRLSCRSSKPGDRVDLRASVQTFQTHAKGPAIASSVSWRFNNSSRG